MFQSNLQFNEKNTVIFWIYYVLVFVYMSLVEHSTHSYTCMCMCRPKGPSESILLSEKAHQTSIYLGLCDKADWGVLVKQFLQNKLLLPKLLLARRSLNWGSSRGELRPKSRSLEKRGRHRNILLLYAHVSGVYWMFVCSRKVDWAKGQWCFL